MSRQAKPRLAGLVTEEFPCVEAAFQTPKPRKCGVKAKKNKAWTRLTTHNVYNVLANIDEAETDAVKDDENGSSTPMAPSPTPPSLSGPWSTSTSIASSCMSSSCSCTSMPACMSTMSPISSTTTAKGVEKQDVSDARRSMAAATLSYLGEASKSAAVQAVNEAQVVASGQWEPLEVIIDSGANVSVGPRHIGKTAGYSIRESEASKAGVVYTAANGGEIPNLGERFLAVVTEEGTVRGMSQQVADVTTALEAVRANLQAGHAVIFNDDGSGNGSGSYMVNKATGEINLIHDDGRNFIMKRWIIPVQEVHSYLGGTQGDDVAASGFTGQGS